MNYFLVKRTFDVMVSLVALILLAPVLIIIALLVRIKLGTPIFFRQARPGRGGKPFQLIKFRTMTSQRGSNGELLPDQQRLTPFGMFLRNSSLDELPELLNVLRGEMSLVGPRPLLMKYLSLYTPEQMRRHALPPGITGWAQVNGRNQISWHEKFALDVWYVDNCSLWLDLKILFMTLWKVLARDGISQEGQATTEEFRGQAEVY